MYNESSLDTLCAAIAFAMGIDAPKLSAPANTALTDYITKTLGDEKCDRVVMFNPDAVAQWIVEKYPEFVKEVTSRTDLELKLKTVMPSVTPVCFGTMYTGTQPEVHGIKSYEKPVIKIDSLFDAAIRAGKKCAIIADEGCSMSKIYLERNMDYFIYKTLEEVHAKAVELILADKYDLLAIYNYEYDGTMHGHGPESPISLGALKSNSEIYAMLDCLIKNNCSSHNTLIGFAMDHGCHEIDGGFGSHGLDMEEDLNIKHFYKIHKKTEK